MSETDSWSRRRSLALLSLAALPARATAQANVETVEQPADDGVPTGVVNLLDALSVGERSDARSRRPRIDLTAKINRILAENAHVEIRHASFLVRYIEIPPTLRSLRSLSKEEPTFIRLPGSPGPMFRCSIGRNVHAHIEGIHIVGSGDAAETCGFDLTGFSYTTFIDCRARDFRLDGWYCKGVLAPANRQVSNLVLVNCIGNANGRDGFRAEGTAQLPVENTANTFLGGEFSGNGNFGIYGEVCEGTRFTGTVCQSNRAGDLYLNTRFCTFEGYTESGARNVRLGPRSHGCTVTIRSTYPLWNSFVDEGAANRISVMGEVEPEQHLFANSCWIDWSGNAPAGLTPHGTLGFGSQPDPGSLGGASLRLALTANLQGLILDLATTAQEIAGRWVTLIVELDTGGATDPLESRVYARDGIELHLIEGAFAIERLAGIVPRQGFTTCVWDVRFPDTVRGKPSLIWFPAYAGVRNAGNTILIRSARVVLGQTRHAGWPGVAGTDPPRATAAEIADAACGINIHRKRAGRLVYDISGRRLLVAASDAPDGAWRAFDGSAGIVPRAVR